MNKEYRKMTAEERIRLIQAAMNEDGFVELKRIMDEYEPILVIKETPSVHTTDKKIEPIRDKLNKEGLAGFAAAQNDNPQHYVEEKTHSVIIEPTSESGSIYASEHRQIAIEENGIGENALKVMEEPKARVLEKSVSRPNPWGYAEIVSPGTIKL